MPQGMSIGLSVPMNIRLSFPNDVFGGDICNGVLAFFVRDDVRLYVITMMMNEYVMIAMSKGRCISGNKIYIYTEK